jgi:hypothetical protein
MIKGNFLSPNTIGELHMRTAGIIRIIVGLIIAVLLTALLVSAQAARSFLRPSGLEHDG